MSETVRTMFAAIARRYDVGNDVLSFGIHRLWKRRMVERASAPVRGRVLDLATGTGDIALLFSDAVGDGGVVVGSDFCPEMIDLARRRPRNARPNLHFEVGDAMDLPYDDDSFDVTSISFGIRNVDGPVVALREMKRVTRPGGRVVVLEFGQPEGLFGLLYRGYSSLILPVAGAIISGSFKAYDYLNSSAARFPCGDRFVRLMNEAGMGNVEVEPLFGGIAWLYVATIAAEEEGAAKVVPKEMMEVGR